MSREPFEQNQYVIDFTFVASFISMIVSLLAVYLDVVFLIPTLVFLSLWVGMTIATLIKKGVDVRDLLSRGKVLPSARLPINRKLRIVYILSLLTSLMIFFGLMMFMHQSYLLMTFIIWILIGFLAMDELEAENKTTKRKATTKAG